MSEIRVTTTEDSLSGVAEVRSIQVFTYSGSAPASGGGGGGGAVASVNGETGVVVLSSADVGAQPVDSDLTAIAALTTTSFGRALLALADAGALRTAAGLGTAAVAATGDFDAAGAASSAQAAAGTYTDTKVAAEVTRANGAYDATGAAAAAQAASQPLDSDLTAIAALTTTTFGRSLLTAADAAAARALTGAGTSSFDGAYSSLTGKPTLGTAAPLNVPAAGNAASGEVVKGSDGRLTDSRTPTAHASSHASAGSDPVTIAESQVTNLTADLAAKAPLASPTFTGTPAAPTAVGGTNTTQVATTAFVTAAVVGAGGYIDPLTSKGDIVGRSSSATVRKAVGSNGAALFADSAQTDGLNWRAIAESDVTNLATDLAAKAPLASPTFTGTPAAPTPTAADSTTKVATTAFVQGELTAKAPLASPALTGNPTAPTQTAGNNSTRLATTAYVDTASGLLVPKSLVTTKGDLLAGTASATLARVGVGADGTVLTADSAQTAGVKWATPSAGGGIQQVGAWRSGAYYGHAYQTNYSLAAVALSTIGASGVMDLHPLWVPASYSVDRMTLECTTTGVSAVVRLGLYNSDANGAPSTLVQEFGTVDASATGERAASATKALTPGLYWMAYLIETSTGSWRAMGSSSFAGTLGFAGGTSATSQVNRYRATGVTTGAMPGTVPTVTGGTDTSHLLMRIRAV